MLLFVVRGEQEAADAMLNRCPELLLIACDVTDYSARRFKKITAYEYACWAKDTHMCRMLELNMDKNTKARMLTRCEAIEEHGLKYSQNGTEYCSKHFELTTLKTALKNYIDGCENWKITNNESAMKAAWIAVGQAQRDVPVHVINEYCRLDRSFAPLPTFNEDKLPRIITFYNYRVEQVEAVFPLSISDSTGLGVDFALLRGEESGRVGLRWARWMCAAHADVLDLEALTHLDQVRTNDLTLSRQRLKQLDQGCSSSLGP